MQFDKFTNILKDTRAFPIGFSKNQLIYYANQILFENKMSSEIAEKLLVESIENMLMNNDFLNFSVALSLSPSSKHYEVLWNCLDLVLQSKNKFELQWLVWPVIFVIGSNKKFVTSSLIPLDNIKKLLNSTTLTSYKNLFWFNNLITLNNFSDISPADWFNSKTDKAILDKILNSIKVEDLSFNLGQDVLLFYALSYGDYNSKDILFNPLKELSLPLMQVWQSHFNIKENSASIFINPLSACTPALAISRGNYIKKQMQFDIFVSNTIRKIRMKNLEPMVIISTKEGGVIEILITIYQSNYEEYYKFAWNLNFIEDINNVLQSILNLFIECKINFIKMLKTPLLLTGDIISSLDLADMVDIHIS